MKIKQKQDNLLEYLKQGYSVNNLVALRELGINSAQLYYFIFKLKEKGWEIDSSWHRSKYAPVSFKEYKLSPNWRLQSEVLKREKISKSPQKEREYDIRDIRIGDIITTKDGKEGFVYNISYTGTVKFATQDGEDLAVCIRAITKRRR